MIDSLFMLFAVSAYVLLLAAVGSIAARVNDTQEKLTNLITTVRPVIDALPEATREVRRGHDRAQDRHDQLVEALAELADNVGGHLGQIRGFEEKTIVALEHVAEVLRPFEGEDEGDEEGPPDVPPTLLN